MKNIKLSHLLKTKKAFKKALGINTKSVKFVSEFKGGMSNLNYLFSANEKMYVVHISEKGFDLFVSRDDELKALACLNDFPFSQKPLYLSDRVRIFNFIDGECLNKIEYTKYLNEIAASAKRLHNISTIGMKEYRPFDYISSMIKELNTEFDPLFTESYKILMDNKEMLEKRPLTLCHNDMQPSNLVLGKDNNVYFIDFEFSKLNDYLFDIATFGNLNFNDSLELIKVYKPNYTMEELNVLKLWRIFVNVQWYLVALKKDFMGYSKKLKMDFKEISVFFLSKNRDIIDSLA